MANEERNVRDDHIYITFLWYNNINNGYLRLISSKNKRLVP